MSYAAIHCGMTNEIVENYAEYPSREEMAQYLTDINLGYEPEKNKHFDWFKLAKRKTKDIEKYWLACKLTNNLGDISRIKELPYADFWTCSFPCTDISVAGKMKGLDPGSETRSSLLWENVKLLKKAKENNTLPKYIMVENVKNLVSKKFMKHFNNLIEVFDDLGFNSYWSVINGKDCGVPQNRERVFIIAIRKDIDTESYTFPTPFDTGIRLKDVLEEVVDEKYYITNDKAQKLLDSDFVQERLRIQTSDICGCLLARDYKDPKCVTVEEDKVICEQRVDEGIRFFKDDICGTLRTIDACGDKRVIEVGVDKSVNNTSIIEYANCITSREDRGISNRKSEGTAILEQTHFPNRVGNIYGEDKGTGYAGNVWDKEALCPALTTMQGGNREPMIIDGEHTIKERFFKQAYETFKENDCNSGDTINAFNKSVNKSGYCPTLTTRPEGFKTAILPVVESIDQKYIDNVSDDFKFAKQKTQEMYDEQQELPEMFNPYNKQEIKEYSPTLTTTCDRSCSSSTVLIKKSNLRIRKLTPRECWKLMGLTFDDCDKAAKLGVSNSQLYKQAGNGIITNCCELLAEHLYKAQYDKSFVCKDENSTRPQVE